MASRLAARVAALEARSELLAGFKPYLATCVRHCESEPEILGAQSLEGMSVMRLPVEPLETFIERASIELGQWFLLALH